MPTGPTKYEGWVIQTMPDVPMPVSIEWKHLFQNAVNTNTYTAQQQVIQWNAFGYYTASVQMPPLLQGTDDTTGLYANGTHWQTFLEACAGSASVFTFPARWITVNPDWSTPMTTDGSTMRYFRLMTQEDDWKISEGNLYSYVFEVRQAL